jgi:aspartokinase
MPHGKPLVMKFGGSSMGTAESITRVIRIMREQASTSAAVTVVSAMAGVTDRLLGIGEQALLRKRIKVDGALRQLQELHNRTFAALAAGPETRSWIARFVNRQLEEIKGIAQGIIL